MSLLADRCAIVTGAAQGIGAALAEVLAAEGAAVVIADVLDGGDVAARITAAGGRATAVNCDVSDEASVQAAVDAAVAAYGRVDILVNNAALFGKVQNVSLFDIRVEDWDRMMAVNVKGPWLMSRAAAPAMTAGGAIIHISTNRVFMGVADLLHYDASKGAVVAMTRSMARELGDRGIRVNSIAPGLTMSENVLNRDGIGERAPQIAARRPLKRDQQPADLVGAVIFLAGDAAGFITGQTLVVDGGSVMR